VCWFLKRCKILNILIFSQNISWVLWDSWITSCRWRDIPDMVGGNILYKKRVFQILQRLKYKGSLNDKCFCCHPEGQPPVWFPFNRDFERVLLDRDHVWKETWLVTFLFAGMRRLWVYTKVDPGQQLLLEVSRSYHSDCISQLIKAWIGKTYLFLRISTTSRKTWSAMLKSHVITKHRYF